MRFQADEGAAKKDNSFLSTTTMPLVYYPMSVDIRLGIISLPPGDPDAPPYIFIPHWPLDPNAPIIEDQQEFDEEDW
jgi:hypothetical protein